MVEGMKKRRTLRAEQKEGATLAMVLDVLGYLRASEERYRKAGQTRLADCALRNQVSIILAFWGMRRGGEIFLNGARTQGLRREDVTLTKG
eukprot:3709944-Rhodomonas_salina.1